MRNAFCESLVRISQTGDPSFYFLTGDLGYKALEPLREAAGERFLNAGIAEQNMVSVAAGLASTGFRPWVYSIAPFLYARAYEQIRNDVCLHSLPVRLVGNGGGYGYGVMGATHHALEDYGALLCFQGGIRAYIPAFADDVCPIVERLATPGESEHPAYLRLGRDEKPPGFALPMSYAPWRRVLAGSEEVGVLVIVGPLAGPILHRALALPPAQRPIVWIVSELPILPTSIPSAFLADLASGGRRLVVAEEHVSNGSAGLALLSALFTGGVTPRYFTHHCAQGYQSGRYGSQAFHRRESYLDAESVLASLATPVGRSVDFPMAHL